MPAVRSSAADEDSGAHSFAGLHQTQLGVAPRGVAAAVRKCWASLWAPEAIAYGRTGGRMRPATANNHVPGASSGSNGAGTKPRGGKGFQTKGDLQDYVKGMR